MGSNTTQFYIVNNNTSQDLSEFETDVYLDYASQLDEAAESYKDYAEAYEYYTFQANYYRTTANWAKNASDDVKDKYMEKGGTPSLDGNYTVFGQVYDGFDVIEKISSADVQDNGSGEVSSPVDTITIGSVKVYEYSSNE
jgi:cyclophilin family peptidyl-prolyl cis-trans isomerase